MVSGLAPGRPAETEMVGNSTCGSGETGRKKYATAPASAMAMVSSVVPTGRWMKGEEMLMRPPAAPSAAPPQPRQLCDAGRTAAPGGRKEVDDRRRVQRQDLAEDQPADHGDAQRPAQFRPDAGAQRQRDAAEQRRHGGHHDRPEPQQAGLVDRLQRRLALACARASRAKSIIMMPFFLTMPISRMMPMSAMTLKSVAADQQRQQRAHAGRGQRREDRDGVDVALVQHAQHDVDRDQRRQDQQRLVGQRGLERLGRALELRLDARGQSQLGLRACRRRQPHRPATRRARG